MNAPGRGQSCSDGLCGAEDCPRCRPGCDAVVCASCGDTASSAGEGGFTACESCGVWLCHQCAIDYAGEVLCTSCYNEEVECN